MMNRVVNVLGQRSLMDEADVTVRDLRVRCVVCGAFAGKSCEPMFFNDEYRPVVHNVRLMDMHRPVPDHSATEFWLWGLWMFLVVMTVPGIMYLAQP
jgi:hypothetical protein